MDRLDLGQELPANSLTITPFAYFIKDELETLEGHVLQKTCIVQIKGELLREAFWIQVRVEHEVGALPGVSELTARQAQPLVRHRVVGDPATVQADRLLFEEAGHSLVGGDGVREGR